MVQDIKKKRKEERSHRVRENAEEVANLKILNGEKRKQAGRGPEHP